MQQVPDTVVVLPALAPLTGHLFVTCFRSLFAFAATLSVAVAGFLLTLDATGAPTPATSPAAPAATQSESRPSSIEDNWDYVIDAPGVYLDRAHDELRRKQRADAASSVRTAAAMLVIEATRAKGADRQRLKRDAGTLLEVAATIDSGVLADARRLNQVVAPARCDLAIHHDMKAAQAWLRHDRLAAGRSLAAAGRYANDALIGLDARLPPDVSEALRQVERMGNQIADGAESASEAEWAKARDALTCALRFMGLQVEAGRTAPG